MSSHWYENPWLDTWTETSSKMFENMLAANQAAAAAWGVPTGGPDGQEANGDQDNLATEPSLDRIEPSGELPEWETTGTAEAPEEIGVGDLFEFTKTITEADVKRFAVASGDTNPLHLDGEFAEETRFQDRIAHGTLVGGLISAALARVPGLVIYLSQDLEFHSPVEIDDRVTAECEVIEDLGNNQYRLRTLVLNGEETAIDGEAVILIDEAPGDEDAAS